MMSMFPLRLCVVVVVCAYIADASAIPVHRIVKRATVDEWLDGLTAEDWEREGGPPLGEATRIEWLEQVDLVYAPVLQTTIDLRGTERCLDQITDGYIYVAWGHQDVVHEYETYCIINKIAKGAKDGRRCIEGGFIKVANYFKCLIERTKEGRFRTDGENLRELWKTSLRLSEYDSTDVKSSVDDINQFIEQFENVPGTPTKCRTLQDDLRLQIEEFELKRELAKILALLKKIVPLTKDEITQLTEEKSIIEERLEEIAKMRRDAAVIESESETSETDEASQCVDKDDPHGVNKTEEAVDDVKKARASVEACCLKLLALFRSESLYQDDKDTLLSLLEKQKEILEKLKKAVPDSADRLQDIIDIINGQIAQITGRR